MEETIEDLDSQTQEETVDSTTTEVEQPAEPETPESTEPIEAEVETDEEKEKLKKENQSLYEQLKKAKGFTRNDKGEWVKKETPKPVEKESGLSAIDAIALMSAKVTNAEDIAEVKAYADFKGTSIEEALKSTVVKTLLAEKSEERKTAEATTVSAPARHGKKPPSGADFLRKASTSGELPGSDEDLEALAEARMEARKNKNK